MHKLKPKLDEHKLVGSWFMEDRRMKADATCNRINLLTEHYFRRLTDGNWEALFEDPEDGRLWELTFPQSYRHGGGPPALEKVTRDYARSK